MITPEGIYWKTKEWFKEGNAYPYTVGDIMMFAFEDVVVTGQEVEKAVFSLANDGFLIYAGDKCGQKSFQRRLCN